MQMNEDDAIKMMEQLFAGAAKSHAATRKEFAAIDRFHASRRGFSPKAYNHRAAGSIHDLAVNNPLLRKQLRELQNGK
jgi:hypothetical protein